MSAAPMKLPAAILPAAASVLGVVAIASAYVFAVVRGDQPFGLHNLPDITHCVLKQPERGLFLTLFMPACMMMAASWMLGAPHSRTAWITGVSGSFLLVVGEAMLDAKPNWTIHTIGASGFFLCSTVAQVVRAWSPAANETRGSLNTKRALAGFTVGALLVDGVLALTKVGSPWAPNLIEWTLAFTVAAFHATFAYDLKGASIALQMPAAPARPAGARAEALISKC